MRAGWAGNRATFDGNADRMTGTAESEMQWRGVRRATTVARPFGGEVRGRAAHAAGRLAARRANDPPTGSRGVVLT